MHGFVRENHSFLWKETDMILQIYLPVFFIFVFYSHSVTSHQIFACFLYMLHCSTEFLPYSIKITSFFRYSMCCMIKLLAKSFRFWWVFKTLAIFQVISVKQHLHQMHSFSPQLKSKLTGRLMCEKMYTDFL